MMVQRVLDGVVKETIERVVEEEGSGWRDGRALCERVEQQRHREEQRVGRRNGLKRLRERCEEAAETLRREAVEQREERELQQEAREERVEEVGGSPQAEEERGSGLGGGLQECGVEIVGGCVVGGGG